MRDNNYRLEIYYHLVGGEKYQKINYPYMSKEECRQLQRSYIDKLADEYAVWIVTFSNTREVVFLSKSISSLVFNMVED